MNARKRSRTLYSFSIESWSVRLIVMPDAPEKHRNKDISMQQEIILIHPASRINLFFDAVEIDLKLSEVVRAAAQ
jgi:hypothetical protein